MQGFSSIFIFHKTLFLRCGIHSSSVYVHTVDKRRKFRSQTSDNMNRWRRRGWKSQRREEKKKEDQRRERVRRKKMQVREKGRKVAKHCVFPMIWGSGGSKSRLAKAAGAESSGRMRGKKCTPLWHEAHFEVKTHKTPQLPSTFRNQAVEKVYAVVPG